LIGYFESSLAAEEYLLNVFSFVFDFRKKKEEKEYRTAATNTHRASAVVQRRRKKKIRTHNYKVLCVHELMF
jgi:hypothetical protein